MQTPESTSTADSIQWSEPVNLIWKRVKNNTYHDLSQDQRDQFVLAGGSTDHDPIFITKQIVPVNEYPWLGIGTYRPKDSKDFHFPNLNISDKDSANVFYEDAYSMVLTALPLEGSDNGVQWAWVQVDLTQEDLPEQAWCFGTMNKIAIARTWSSASRVHNIEGSELPDHYRYVVGAYDSRLSDTEAYFPYSDKRETAHVVEILVVRPAVEADKEVWPSAALRWQMLNASMASYVREKSFSKYFMRAQFDPLFATYFEAACPTAKVEGVEPDELYSLVPPSSYEEDRQNLPEYKTVNKYQDYLNLVMISRRDEQPNQLVVTFRGTNTKHKEDYLLDALAGQVDFPNAEGHTIGHVHAGFYYATLGLASRVWSAMDANENTDIIFTGHSKGGAMAGVMALLTATDPGMKGKYKSLQVITFAAPKFGDKELMRYYGKHVHKSMNYCNGADIVPLLPLSKAEDYDIVEVFEELGKIKISKKAIAINLLGLVTKKMGKYPGVTLDQTSTFKQFAEQLDEALTKNLDTTDPNERIQEALKNLAPTINAMPDWLSDQLDSWEGNSTSDTLKEQAGTLALLVFSIFCVVDDKALDFMRLAWSKDPEFSYQRKSNNIISAWSALLSFFQRFPGYALDTGTKGLHAYQYTQELQYMVPDGDELTMYDSIDEELFKKEFSPNSADLEAWAERLEDNHNDYVSVLNPFDEMKIVEG